jgi:hypothetical protein
VNTDDFMIFDFSKWHRAGAFGPNIILPNCPLPKKSPC